MFKLEKIQNTNSVCLLHSKSKTKREVKREKIQKPKLEFFKREKDLFLSRISRDPTVDNLRDKKKSCYTRSELHVDTGFEEF